MLPVAFISLSNAHLWPEIETYRRKTDRKRTFKAAGVDSASAVCIASQGLNMFRATSSSKYIYKALEPAGWLFLYEMSELCWQSNNAAE